MDPNLIQNPISPREKMSWISEKFSPLRYTPMEKHHHTTTLANLLNRIVVDDDDDHVDVALPHQVINNGGAHQPRFVLSFSNLTYSVKCKSDGSKAKTKTLLNSITGEVKEGEILAVMGASGSGKSTLIDALANRISKHSLTGSITVNGEDVDEKVFKSISAYVMQDDLLYPMLTVEETLMFSAEFRLPRTLSRSKKKARVEALIDHLGLRFAAKTIIGDEGHRGVSGGERRRVSIGTDIIHDPILLFLDEPTSGLDSTSAFMVVKVLQRIALTGSIVIMSVHQPSSRLLGLLDRILFLSRGQMVYNGSPNGLSLYFSEFGHPIPENENRVEFALDLIRELESADSDGGSGSGGIGQLVQFYKSWQILKYSSTSKFDGSVSLKDAIASSISRGKLVSGNKTFANPPWIEMLVLVKRSIINSRRMPEFFIMRLAAMLVTGCVLATVFWKLDDTPKGIMERLGVLAFAMSTIYYSSVEALPVFLQERYIFMRETAYNAYRRSSYVLCNAVVELPSNISLALAFSATTFFAVGLTGGPPGFLFFFLTIFASFWAGSSFITFLSGVIPHLMIGYTIAVAMLAYFLLFCGFFINRGRIPGFWIWFHYLSLEKYPYEAVLHNEFDSNKCFTKGVQIFDNTIMEVLSEATKVKALSAISGVLGVPLTNETCLTTGRDVLRAQEANELRKWNCLLVTVAWGFFFRVLFYFALLLGSKNKRM